MKVRLHLSVLQDPGGFDRLDEIARLLRTGRHRWVFDEDHLEAIETCSWLTDEPDSRATRRHRELFVKTAKLAVERRGTSLRDPEGADPPPRAHEIELEVGCEGGLSLAEGLARLEHPAVLWVEDDRSDDRFVRCLIQVFQREELAQALEEGWLEIEHAGGKDGIRPRGSTSCKRSRANSTSVRFHEMSSFASCSPRRGRVTSKEQNWSRLARSVGDELIDSIDAGYEALHGAVKFLKEDIGVAHVRLVPYAAQIVQLAAFHLVVPTPTSEQRSVLMRWFWSTSFSGWFAGANTTTLKLTIEAMRKYARGEIEAEELPGYDQPALPYPIRFDLKSARLRTLILWQLRGLGPLGLESDPVEVREQLALHETRAWRYIFTRQLRGSDLKSDPANRILLPLDPRTSARQAIVDLDPARADHARILASHFITPEAHRALAEEEHERFVELRSTAMMEGERAFIRELGLAVADQERSEPGIDADP